MDYTGVDYPLAVDVDHKSTSHIRASNSVLTKTRKVFINDQVILNIFIQPGFMNANPTYGFRGIRKGKRLAKQSIFLTKALMLVLTKTRAITLLGVRSPWSV